MIETHRQEAMPFKEIPGKLNSFDKVFKKLLKGSKIYAKRNPKKLKQTARDNRSIVKLASNCTISLTKIKPTLNLPVCKETVLKALHTIPNIIQSKIAPNLTLTHKGRRLKFLKLNIARQ